MQTIIEDCEFSSKLTYFLEIESLSVIQANSVELSYLGHFCRI